MPLPCPQYRAASCGCDRGGNGQSAGSGRPTGSPLLGEAIRHAGEDGAHLHPDCEILAPHVAGADPLGSRSPMTDARSVRLTSDGLYRRSPSGSELRYTLISCAKSQRCGTGDSGLSGLKSIGADLEFADGRVAQASMSTSLWPDRDARGQSLGQGLYCARWRYCNRRPDSLVVLFGRLLVPFLFSVPKPKSHQAERHSPERSQSRGPLVFQNTLRHQ